MLVSQEVAVAAATVAAKEEDDEVSDKGSESDEGEANKDSPSERDEDSDKQSDTEVDEMAGDDEEVRGLLKHKKCSAQSVYKCKEKGKTFSLILHSAPVRSGKHCSRASSGESGPCWRPSRR